MASNEKTRMPRSPSHESVTTDLSLLSVSSLSVDTRGRHLTCKTPTELLYRGPSPNPEVKMHKRPGDVPLPEEGSEILRNCAILCSALGLRRSLSTGDVPHALSPPPGPRCSAGSEARLSWAGGGWLGAASRSCSTWVAVGDSRLPSPHRPAAPAPPPPADLLQALNNKTRQVYIRRRLMTTYRALERMSHSEFNLDQLDVSRNFGYWPGPRELSLRDIERERSRPLTKYERNMMIFDWLHTLDETAPCEPVN